VIPKLEKLKTLLWKEWDPIGCGVPEDEYDSFALPIWSMIKRSATVEQVEAYLVWAETEHIGVSASGRAPAVARKIIELMAD
jgi:hypothetical protein